MGYHFFDYKVFIPEEFKHDMFSIPHIIFIVLAFVGVGLIIAFGRKIKKEYAGIYLKIMSFVVLILEITKVTWETYYDIKTGAGFNVIGIIPVYTCSLYIYTTIIAAWTKGKVQDVCLSFLTTVSLLTGIIGVIYCNGLNFYPFWTFGGFYSLFFHLSMFFTGSFLLATKYKKLEWIDCLKAWIPILILSIVAIPLNYVYGADYMQLYEGGGVPLYSTLAATLASKGLRWIYTIIMLVTYIPLALIIICVYKGLAFVIHKIEHEPAENNNEPVEESQLN